MRACVFYHTKYVYELKGSQSFYCSIDRAVACKNWTIKDKTSWWLKKVIAVAYESVPEFKKGLLILFFYESGHKESVFTIWSALRHVIIQNLSTWSQTREKISFCRK